MIQTKYLFFLKINILVNSFLRKIKGNSLRLFEIAKGPRPWMREFLGEQTCNDIMYE